MPSPNDLLDSIRRARLRVATAEEDVRDAERHLRDRKKGLTEARRVYDLAIAEALDENRQPSLFDAPAEEEPTAPVPYVEVGGPREPVQAIAPPAAVEAPTVPTWRKMPLSETGWAEAKGMNPELWDAIGVKCWTCGELADELLKGETFGAVLMDLEVVLALVEQISEDDERPIRFEDPEVTETLLGETEPERVAPGTQLLDVDNFPDAVFDLLFGRGISTVETLLESLATYDHRVGGLDIPLRNRLTTYLVAEIGAKLKAAEWAADAVARHVEPKPAQHVVRCDKCKATYDATGREKCPSCSKPIAAEPKRDRKKKAAPERTKPFLDSGPVPASVPLTTWDGVPNFPALAAEHLAAHGINCLADLDVHREKIREQRGRQQADRYEALRDLATPHTFTAGDAIVDYEIAKAKAAEPEPTSAKAALKKARAAGQKTFTHTTKPTKRKAGAK